MVGLGGVLQLVEVGGGVMGSLELGGSWEECVDELECE